MKKIFLFILLLLPLVALPQSKESEQYYQKGLELYDDCDFYGALVNLKKSDSLDKAQLDPSSENYYRAESKLVDCYAALAYLFAEDAQYDNAVMAQKKVVEIRKKVLGEEHTDYAAALNNLAHYNSFLGNYAEAVRLATRAIEIQKKVLGEEHPDYATLLSNLATYNTYLGNYVEAIRLETRSMGIRKKVLGEEHPDYALSLNDLAVNNYYLGNYAEAIMLATRAIEIQKKDLGEDHPDYATSLSNLATYNYALGNYAEAIRLGTIAVEIRKKVLGEEHPDYALSLSNIAAYNSDLGNYTEAIRLGTRAMEIDKKVLGKEHPEYTRLLSNLAAYYYDLGNYAEAIRLGTIAVEIRKKVLGEEHPDYALSLSNLAGYHSELGNYTEAIKLGTIAMEIYKKVFGEKHPSYGLSLNNLAMYYLKLGNYAEAIKFESSALKIRKEVFGKEHPIYATALNNLAILNAQLDNYTEAMQLETNVLEIYKKTLGEDHPNITASLCILATLNLITGNYDKATDYYKQWYHRLNSFILRTFASLTTKERSIFWNTTADSFTDDLPYAVYKHQDPTLTALAYDSQVFSKGLLLNTELEIQNLIEESGDTVFANRYNRLKQNRAILDNLYQIAPENREMDADSLAKVIDREEHILVQSSKELGDYTKNLSINWTDVQKKMKENDVAIEFANFKEKKSSDNHIYIALVLKKDMTAPELVTLDFSDTDTIDYTTSTLYNRIWKPLEKYLQGVQNIYFSPTGKLHTIGIEYLPDENGEIFAKKYNAYRLSSTRELAIDHVANLNKKASVYGGIVYNYTQDDWQNVSEDAERAGMTFLKGAKKESEEITNILSENSFNVEYGTDKAATEESFKKLSGSGIKILHIATHGFYEPESKEKSFADMLSVEEKNSKEDLSLSRSGLFFAGANTALDPEQRQFIPDGVDDGILTAKEISRMDFKGLDLVVMSACQTGLGEVTSEGVFGLQRGFKKAGAQTIVMSLWNVSDKPTRELMTEFYRNLVSGKSKREAFILAQDKIRLKYIDPKMWAGFIMVDGIE